MMRMRVAAAAAVLACAGGGAAAIEMMSPSVPHSDLVAHGQYLVTVMACADCHTPGYFLGQPDAARHLAGSDVGFEMPGLGVFYGANLTPDTETGLGAWSDADIVTALTRGQRPDGRMLAPVMPWQAYAALSEPDAKAIAAYLKSLPAVSHKVAGPFGPDEPATGPFHRVIMPESASENP